jgi:hypothetical protein
LFVPVCHSASHIAYGSIRMEPVFMVLGQSSATAASMAIDSNVDVQEVDVEKLKSKLLEDKQVLEWTGGGNATGIDPKKLNGLVLDDKELKRQGEWLSSRSIAGFVGDQYWHDNNDGKGEKLARFSGKVAKAGKHDVRLAYSPNPNRATNVPITVEHAGGSTEVKVNQKQSPAIEKMFTSLGQFELSPEKPLVVSVSNANTDGHVIVDAIWVVPVK